jgi:hypothetical protein
MRFLFVENPSPSIVKKLTALFYGNNVPLDIAITVYRICNDKCSHDMIAQKNHFYKLWQTSIIKAHLATYYNMLHKTFIWINGKALHQLETMKPEVK